MSKSEAKKYYTKNGPSSYNDIVPDFHRSRYSGVVIMFMVTMVTIGTGG